VGGSIAGGIDLYQLLQAYFLFPEVREKMNLIAVSVLFTNPGKR
jgi:hypothetical protein